MAVEYSDIPAYLTYLLPHPTSSYTGFFCHPTPTRSYLILPHPTPDSSTILPSPTLSSPILPHPTSSYTASYLVLHWRLLPSYPVLFYPTSQPTLPTSYHILPRPTLASSAILPLPGPTLSYPILHWILLPSYPVLLYPLPSYHILPRPTPHPTSSYTGGFCHGRMAEHSSVGRRTLRDALTNPV